MGFCGSVRVLWFCASVGIRGSVGFWGSVGVSWFCGGFVVLWFCGIRGSVELKSKPNKGFSEILGLSVFSNCEITAWKFLHWQQLINL